MINADDFLKEIQQNLGFFCPDGLDTNDLLRVAESVAGQGIKTLSVPPESVRFIWTCLENQPTGIHARFDLDSYKENGREKQLSVLSKEINAVFKHGAGGAQIFMSGDDVPMFVSDMHAIRDDLFFNKYLTIGLDINHVGPFDWAGIFNELKKIKADSLLLYISEDTSDAEFAGRVYGLLLAWDKSFRGELHFVLNNDLEKIEAAWRLILKMDSEVSRKVKFFIQN